MRNLLKVVTGGLNELVVHLNVPERVQVDYHVLLLPMDLDNFPIDWVFQHLM